MTTTTRSIAALAWVALCGAVPALAQPVAPLPTKIIRILVSLPPGGSPDIIARKLADKLGPVLGQSPVVENRPGASGTIAADAVAKSAPDGTTLLLSIGSTMVSVPQMMKKLPYDPKDLVPVVHVGTTPFVLVVNAKDPATSLAQMLARAKANPKDVTFGSFGNGTVAHLLGEAINHAAGVQMQHVPYKGTAAGITDLLGGRISMMLTDLGSVRPFLGDRLRALAVTGAHRNAGFPDIPTFGEQGLPTIDPLVSWVGFFAPSATPKPLVARLADELARAIQSEDMRAELVKIGYEPTAVKTDAFAQIVKQDSLRWGKVIQDVGGISLD